MTIREAMAEANELRPNQISDEIKAGWLQRLDNEVGQMLSKTPAETWPEDRPLLMPYPYDRIYPLYLAAQIDYYNSESDLYMNDMQVYTKAMAEARAWFRRNNMPDTKQDWKVGW